MCDSIPQRHEEAGRDAKGSLRFQKNHVLRKRVPPNFYRDYKIAAKKIKTTLIKSTIQETKCPPNEDEKTNSKENAPPQETQGKNRNLE